MRSREIEELKRSLKLSSDQREILVGLMLGDGHLESRDSGRTYRLKIEQCEAHRAYVSHLHEVFRDWVRTPPREKLARSKGCESKNICFQTYSHPAFRFYAQQFYRERRKVVPKQIDRFLTPKAVAYWYMDDGSIKSKQSKGVIFNTQGFAADDVARLCEALGRHGLDVKIRKQKDGLQIYVSGTSFETFLELIEPHTVPEMQYKIPQRRQTRMPKE